MVMPFLTKLAPIFLLGYMRSIGLALPELFCVNIQALKEGRPTEVI